MYYVIQCRFSEFLIQLCIENAFFFRSVQKYYYHVQKNCLFLGPCRNITIQGQGVPGVSCRAFFGVREEILIFGEIYTSGQDTPQKWWRHLWTAPYSHYLLKHLDHTPVSCHWSYEEWYLYMIYTPQLIWYTFTFENRLSPIIRDEQMFSALTLYFFQSSQTL